MEMTLDKIKAICKELQLYNTPSLNDKLYLHYKGWQRIEPCIGEYSGVKALWLEGNGLDKIENLDNLRQLRCLFMNNNLVETVEGLDNNLELDTLNLSNNQIAKIQNLSHLPCLTTVHFANNRLCSAEDIQHLEECKSISVVEISNNKLDDPKVLDVFANMKNLRVLHLSGNPVIRKIEHYRKAVISRCKSLQYLDDRPVFEDERRCCSAWEQGGFEAEKAERALIKQEKLDKEKRNREAFQKMLDDARAKRESNKNNNDKEEKSWVVHKNDNEGNLEDEIRVGGSKTRNANNEDKNDDKDKDKDQYLEVLRESKQKEQPPVSRYETDDIFGEDPSPAPQRDDDSNNSNNNDNHRYGNNNDNDNNSNYNYKHNDDDLDVDVPPLQDGEEDREQYLELLGKFQTELQSFRVEKEKQMKKEKRNTAMKITMKPSRDDDGGEGEAEEEEEVPGTVALKLLQEDLSKMKEQTAVNMEELD